MDHQPPADALVTPDSRSGGRKTWHKPEITLLPVELTQTQSSTGNDGNGTFTSS